MITIFCDKCGVNIESIRIDHKTSIDYLDFWRKAENHLCNNCWVQEMKIIDLERKKMKLYFSQNKSGQSKSIPGASFQRSSNFRFKA
jgi:hypothetical protein